MFLISGKTGHFTLHGDFDYSTRVTYGAAPPECARKAEEHMLYEAATIKDASQEQVNSYLNYPSIKECCSDPSFSMRIAGALRSGKDIQSGPGCKFQEKGRRSDGKMEYVELSLTNHEDFDARPEEVYKQEGLRNGWFEVATFCLGDHTGYETDERSYLQSLIDHSNSTVSSVAKKYKETAFGDTSEQAD